MIDGADLRAGLAMVGLPEAAAPSILAAADLSAARIRRAREALAAIPGGRGIPVVLGSHGRHEAIDGSDFDLAYLHDPADCADAEAEDDRRACVQALRAAGFDVPEKTFCRPLSLRDLLANVGGPRDTNEHLTHRALLLTESAWLRDREASREAWARLYALYRDGLTRGKWMASLLNDLHRYYRTVCLDYRHKIEEADKGWALRYLKLRHSRKTLHLSNLVLHCAGRALNAPGDFDSWLAARLSEPPLLKIARAMHDLGDASASADLWRRYERFLSLLGDAGTRAELDALPPQDESSSAAFRALKENARGLDAACERVVAPLLSDPRTRGHLLRFGLL